MDDGDGEQQEEDEHVSVGAVDHQRFSTAGTWRTGT